MMVFVAQLILAILTVDAQTPQTTLLVMTRILAPLIPAFKERDVSTPQWTVVMETNVPLISALTENANTSSLVMMQMHAPPILVSMDNASTLQRAVTTAIHAPPILATKLLDARTSQSSVTTTTHAPKIPAIPTLDASTPQWTAVMETNVLLILVSMETAFTHKKLAMITTNAQPKSAILNPETAFTLL
jgi:hypothetical protein